MYNVDKIAAAIKTSILSKNPGRKFNVNVTEIKECTSEFKVTDNWCYKVYTQSGMSRKNPNNLAPFTSVEHRAKRQIETMEASLDGSELSSVMGTLSEIVDSNNSKKNQFNVNSKSMVYAGFSICNECNGNNKINCRSCSGVGKQKCTTTDCHFGVKNCWSCDNGIKPSGYRCQACNGKGTTNCNECNRNGYGGRGYIECTRCRGQGSRMCSVCVDGKVSEKITIMSVCNKQKPTLDVSQIPEEFISKQIKKSFRSDTDPLPVYHISTGPITQNGITLSYTSIKKVEVFYVTFKIDSKTAQAIVYSNGVNGILLCGEFSEDLRNILPYTTHPDYQQGETQAQFTTRQAEIAERKRIQRELAKAHKEEGTSRAVNLMNFSLYNLLQPTAFSFMFIYLVVVIIDTLCYGVTPYSGFGDNTVHNKENFTWILGLIFYGFSLVLGLIFYPLSVFFVKPMVSKVKIVLMRMTVSAPIYFCIFYTIMFVLRNSKYQSKLEGHNGYTFVEFDITQFTISFIQTFAIWNYILPFAFLIAILRYRRKRYFMVKEVVAEYKLNELSKEIFGKSL